MNNPIFDFLGILACIFIVILFIIFFVNIENVFNWCLKCINNVKLRLFCRKYKYNKGDIIYYESGYWTIIKLVGLKYTIININSKRIQSVNCDELIQNSVKQNDLLNSKLEYKALNELYDELGDSE